MAILIIKYGHEFVSFIRKNIYVMKVFIFNHALA